jgi:hypothetical protein
MRKLIALLILAPALTLAQSTYLKGPDGSGNVDTPRVTAEQGLQVDVTRVQGANTTSSCTVNATGGFCSTSMLGKSTFGVQVTAISSPSGITIQPEVSLDGGTTWKAVKFENATGDDRSLTITSFTAADTYSVIGVSGATHYRLNCTARTSGSVTFQATASDAMGATYYKPLSTTFATSGLATATTLTQLIAAPASGISIHVKSIHMSASVAATTTADQQLTLKYGTGTNCGTGTTYLWGSFNPANGGFTVSFPLGADLQLPAANALCWIHAATGSKIVNVLYYLGP